MAGDVAGRDATAVTSATTASFADLITISAWTRLPHPLLDRLATHARSRCRTRLPNQLELGGTGPKTGLVQCGIGPKPGLVQCGTGSNPNSLEAEAEEDAAEEAAGSCIWGKRRGAVTLRRRRRPSHLNRSSCSLRQELLPLAYALELQCGHSDGPDDARASFPSAAHTVLLHAWSRGATMHSWIEHGSKEAAFKTSNAVE